MVKIIASLLLSCATLFALSIDEKIKSFIGKEKFYIQKNLIHILFEQQSQYYLDANQTHDLKILQTLKENGLLKLFHNTPVQMRLHFETSSDKALIFMRAINESLEALGYSYFLSEEIQKNDAYFSWSIALETEHLVDPILFAKELAAKGCNIIEIAREQELHWRYKIDSANIHIQAEVFPSHSTINLKKPIKDYWIDVSGMKSISLQSRLADRWYPNIVMYDNNLKMLHFYRYDTQQNTLKFTIPDTVKYIKIGDTFTLENIKRGLSVYLVNR
ncbi:MAG: hypothetical protein IBX44_05135 [Sulfurospirillum sp.]|nr:hypothetical protein [Sulfurospirillum sp.]